MTRIVQTLIALPLLFLLWNYVGDALPVATPAEEAAFSFYMNEADDSSRVQTIHHNHYSRSQLPDMPSAEWSSITTPARLLTFMRTQRTQPNEEVLFIEDAIDRLNNRFGALSRDKEKATNHNRHFARFACEYYVFTLRHILI
ncbi:MAG: hypothetical protein LBN06_06395 [Prevotellaceae bacterium]|jgi:hypothetical protein|nr:hypothetical protein [Prevotellaceae bacterium]